MPGRRNHNEESKDEDLQNQAPQDDVLSSLDAIAILGLDEHACATRLYEKTENVTRDKDSCDQAGAHNGVGCGICAEDQASQNHVDGSGEEDRSDEDQDGLSNVRGLVGEIGVGSSTGAVPDGFKLRIQSALCPGWCMEIAIQR